MSTTQRTKTWLKDPRHRIAFWVIAVPIILLILIVIVKSISRSMELHRREKSVKQGPIVRVVKVLPPQQKQILTLIGEARPYDSVTLYARISGYLRTVRVDKGDAVHEGQLLAVIDSPEATQDYAGAAADARNKHAIAERTRPLLERKLVSQQEADQIFADADIADSRLKSVAAQRGYTEIRAPFDGVVTGRFVDPGALIQNSANPVFTMSRFDRLRVYVYVDQRDAASVKVGQPATITLSERPGLKVNAKISRAAGELDPKTRMMLAELDVDNRATDLVAGSYVQVALELPSPKFPEVPVEALVYRSEKLFVQIVSDSDTIHYTEVGVADNDGQRAKIFSGLQGGERVALNLGNSVEEGAKIQEAPAEPQKPGDTSAKSVSSSSATVSSSSPTAPGQEQGK